jgi:hypothetical protein
MKSRSRWLAQGLLAAVVAVNFAPRWAHAAEPARPLREAVTLEPGATCLDAATLIEHVRSWVGADTVDADVVVEVRGSPDHDRIVSFRMLRGSQVVAVRTFDPGPSRCEQLHAVLGLSIAMALKASLVDEVSPSVAQPTVPAPPTMLPAPPPDGLLRPWAVVGEGLVALAVLPDPAFGMDARVERALTATFRARLGLLALLAAGETFDVPGHFATWLLAPRIDVCAGLEVAPRLHARGCMGMSGGALHAAGYAYPSSRSTFIRWLAVANELGLNLELSRRWSIGAGATLILPVAQNSIVLRDYSGNVLQQRDLASVGWIFSVGPLIRF